MVIENSASRRKHELQKCFLEDVQAFELWIFWSSLFHSITAEGKKEFERSHALLSIDEYYLLVFLVLHVLTEVGMILNRYLGHWYLKTWKKQHSFLYHILFSRVSKPGSLYSFVIAPVVVNAALYWINSSFWWNVALHIWSYMLWP